MLWTALDPIASACDYVTDRVGTRDLLSGVRRCRQLGVEHVDVVIRGDYERLPRKMIPALSEPQAYALTALRVWYYPRMPEGPDTKFYARYSSRQLRMLPRIVKAWPGDWEAERSRAEALFEEDIRAIAAPGIVSSLDDWELKGSVHAVFLRER